MANAPQDPLSQLEGYLSRAFGLSAPPPQRPAAHQPAHQTAHPQPGHAAAQQSRFSIKDPQNPNHLNIPTWLLLMKTEGHGFGYQRYTDSIQLNVKNGQISAHVDDPAMLREILALRDTKGLQDKMQAAYVKHHKMNIPQVSYAGTNARPDGNIARMQRDLMTLGYDIGAHEASGINDALTQASLKEFIQQTRPAVTPQTEAARLHQAAQAALADSAKYARHNIQMTPAVANAVRNGANASNMSYSYLMQTVQRESSFDPTNSPDPGNPKVARGLYQIIPMTWLGAIKQHGAQYGLGNLANQITGANGYYHLRDKTTYDYAMTLRDDPRLNALLGAHLQADNKAQLPPSLREDQGALYAYQLLGPTTGRIYENGLMHTPDAPAAPALPSDYTHGGNQPVFFEGKRAKSFAEVNAGFNASFTENRIFEPEQPSTKTRVAGDHKPKKPHHSTPA